MMKYIILETYTETLAFLFNKSIDHGTFANKIIDAFGGEVSSAGFVKKENGTYCCYGESVSLGIKSREIDSKIIENML